MKVGHLSIFLSIVLVGEVVVCVFVLGREGVGCALVKFLDRLLLLKSNRLPAYNMRICKCTH